MERGNVLVIGNSGVGKSTLIHAVLGERTKTTMTRELLVREPLEDQKEEIRFRMIDTIGFEPSWNGTHKAIQAVQKWSAQNIKEGREDSQISVIWFCVDGTSKRLFEKTIANLSKATSIWSSVPILVVITKSYSVPEREENRKMVYDAFIAQKRLTKNLRGVIPVVADTFVLNENAFAAPEGIEDLVEITNSLLPEGIKAAKEDIESFKLNRKRTLAQGVVAAAAATGVVVGAVPVPVPDAAILVPTEMAMITAIARVYGIKKDDQSSEFFMTILGAGTVSMAAKTALNTLKAIPGVNLGAAVLNAIVAGSIVAALGEGSIFIFEQIYLGKKTFEDVDWVTKIIESKLSGQFVEKVNQVMEMVADKTDNKAIGKAIWDLFIKDMP
ncbi:MAG: DUF697 domain-containing protein [Angelakisella sp.]|nr:DUF697 domain-containing protein [Angelakisella sp.]